MLTDEQALALAVHEVGHAAAARRLGYGATPMLWPNGEGWAYYERPLRPDDLRLVAVAGPLAEHWHLHGPLLASRALWHAWRADRLPFSTMDRQQAAPVTRALLLRGAALITECWPDILLEAPAVAARYRRLVARQQAGEVFEVATA